VINARDLFSLIIKSEIETGGPFYLFKDICNKYNIQDYLGTIQNSNLCTEIIEYSSADSIAVCNLASIALPKFVNTADYTFDYELLFKVTQLVTKNLNKIIDCNNYMHLEAKKSKILNKMIVIEMQDLTGDYEF